MQIQLATRPYASMEADALVTYVFDGDNKLDGVAGEIDRAMSGRLGSLVSSGEITGKALELVLIHFPQGLAAQKLLLVGAGKLGKFATSDLRKIAGAALRHLKSRGVKSFVFLTRESERGPEAAQAVVEGLIVADFESDKYRTDKKKSEIQSASLAGFDGGLAGNLNEAIEHGRVIADSQNFARDLINEPSNYLTPSMLAAKAEAMAKEVGLGIEILDERRIHELKMGALIGVAQGSVEPPRVIILRYVPETAAVGAPLLGLVGKAVTFDTGGISIKPANNMEKMKYDMGGGATMLGAMRALAYLKPKVPVIAIVPATENMPGGRAQKPGDVQVAMSGKTIEVINTDAEGRLILADALARAAELEPDLTIDLATLTGAARVAVGPEIAPFYTDDDGLAAAIEAAARTAEDPVWRMPLWAPYASAIDSDIADLKNDPDAWAQAGSITAALFLKRFAPAGAWAHFDIFAWNGRGRPGWPPGAEAQAIRALFGMLKTRYA